MDSRIIILQGLIARLEPEFGELAKPRTFAALEKKMSGLGEFSLKPGDGHLVQALRMARQALASGDEREIEIAALHCPPFERTGMKLRQDHRAKETRKKGGNTRGKNQTSKAELRWQPYIDQFNSLLAAGKDETTAKGIVKNKMARDGFVVPPKGNFPTAPAIRRWLRKK